MIYPFICKSCGNKTEVIRPASECSYPETCFCGQEMDRVYTVPQFNMSEVRSNYENAKEESRRAGGSGNIIEIGNEDAQPPKKPNKYDNFDMSILNQYPELSQLPD